MGAAVAEGDQSREDGVSTVAATAPPAFGFHAPATSGAAIVAIASLVDRWRHLADFEWVVHLGNTTAARQYLPARPTGCRPGPCPVPGPWSRPWPPAPSSGRGAVHRRGLLLLEADGSDPVDIDSLTFTDDGIGVIRTRGEQARVLPGRRSPPTSSSRGAAG